MNKDHITGRRHDSPKRGKLLPLVLVITFGLLSLHGCGDNVGGEASLLRQYVGGEASLLRQGVGGEASLLRQYVGGEASLLRQYVGSKASSFAKTGQPTTAQMVADSSCQSNAMASTIKTTELRRPDMRVRVRRGDRLVLRTEGLRLTAEDSAVARWGQYSVTALHAEELPPLPEGMVNVTLVGSGLQRSAFQALMIKANSNNSRWSDCGLSVSSYQGRENYMAAMENLINNGFSDSDYKDAVKYFFSESRFGKVYLKAGYTRGTILNDPPIKNILQKRNNK